MVSPGQITTRQSRRPWPGRGGRVALLLLFCVVLLSCSTSSGRARLAANLAPLQLHDHLLSPEMAARVPSPDLLALDRDMREFVRRYTADLGQDRARLMMLHRAVKGAAILGMQYDPQAGGTAQEAFHRGAANCLSYASLFVALAREAGLQADYQWLDTRPQWTRQGERVLVRRHVNALVRLGKREQYMADIDPLEPQEIAGSRQISDTDARALYHSNIAMDALAADDMEQAWLQAVRALQLSPGTAHLWVNLGAIYRANGQHGDAEHSYLYALQLDADEHSAMNNLVVLYGIEGRAEERDYWERRMVRFRDANPFYHAWRGDEAAAAGDWAQAVRYYKRALALSPQDSRLLSALGHSHAQLGEPAVASGYIQRAIQTATASADIAAYQLQLQNLQRKQVVGT